MERAEQSRWAVLVAELVRHGSVSGAVSLVGTSGARSCPIGFEVAALFAQDVAASISGWPASRTTILTGQRS